MSHLGMILGLGNGSRLTDVSFYPLEEEQHSFTPSGAGSGQGTVYFHLLMQQTMHDPGSLAGAISAFLPARLAAISGYRPDGRTWVATAQLDPHDIQEQNAGPQPMRDSAGRSP